MNYPGQPKPYVPDTGTRPSVGGDPSIGPVRGVLLVIGFMVLALLVVLAIAAAQRFGRGESWGEANYNVLRASTPLYNTPTDRLYELSVELGHLSLRAQESAARVDELDRRRNRPRY